MLRAIHVWRQPSWGLAWQMVTHFLLFTQVSEAAMATVPEPTNEVMAYYRSVGKLIPVMWTGLPSQEWSVSSVLEDQICPPKLPLSVASRVPRQTWFKDWFPTISLALALIGHLDVAAGTACRGQTGRKGAKWTIQGIPCHIWLKWDRKLRF